MKKISLLFSVVVLCYFASTYGVQKFTNATVINQNAQFGYKSKMQKALVDVPLSYTNITSGASITSVAFYPHGSTTLFKTVLGSNLNSSDIPQGVWDMVITISGSLYNPSTGIG